MATYTPPPAPDPAAASIPATTPPISVGLIEDQLRSLMDGLTPDPTTRPGRGRPTILPALALWTAVIVCVLHGLPRAMRRLASAHRSGAVGLPALRDQ